MNLVSLDKRRSFSTFRCSDSRNLECSAQDFFDVQLRRGKVNGAAEGWQKGAQMWQLEPPQSAAV